MLLGSYIPNSTCQSVLHFKLSTFDEVFPCSSHTAQWTRSERVENWILVWSLARFQLEDQSETPAAGTGADI